MSEKKSESLAIEEAMQKLEAIVTEMESGQLPLEKMLGRYEEGVQLVRLCQDRLAAAEQRIQIIRRAGEAAAVEPFSAHTQDA